MYLGILVRLVLVALAAFVAIKIVNKLISIRREDKIEQVKYANEEIDATLEAGMAAKGVNESERENLSEAQQKIRDRVDLGKQAR